MHVVLLIRCSCVLGVCCLEAEPCTALRRHIWGCDGTDAKPCPLSKYLCLQEPRPPGSWRASPFPRMPSKWSHLA